MESETERLGRLKIQCFREREEIEKLLVKLHTNLQLLQQEETFLTQQQVQIQQKLAKAERQQVKNTAFPAN